MTDTDARVRELNQWMSTIDPKVWLSVRDDGHGYVTLLVVRGWSPPKVWQRCAREELPAALDLYVAQCRKDVVAAMERAHNSLVAATVALDALGDLAPMEVPRAS